MYMLFMLSYRMLCKKDTWFSLKCLFYSVEKSRRLHSYKPLQWCHKKLSDKHFKDSYEPIIHNTTFRIIVLSYNQQHNKFVKNNQCYCNIIQTIKSFNIMLTRQHKCIYLHLSLTSACWGVYFHVSNIDRSGSPTGQSVQ